MFVAAAVATDDESPSNHLDSGRVTDITTVTVAEITTQAGPDSDRAVATLRSSQGNSRNASHISSTFGIDIVQLEEYLEGCFLVTDKNGDGYVTQEELVSSIPKFPFDTLASSVLMRLSKSFRRDFHTFLNEPAELRQARRALQQVRWNGTLEFRLDNDKIFELLDINGNEMLSPEEFEARYERMSEFIQERRFASLDVNNDGTLDYSEYAVPLEYFLALDTEQDGMLSLAELGQASKENPAER